MDSLPTILKCPKCGHVRDSASDDPPERCASCGLYFEKWAKRDSVAAARAASTPGSASAGHPQLSGVAASTGLIADFRIQLWQRALHRPEKAGNAWLAGRAILLAATLIWSLRLAAMDYRHGDIGGSFMHAILLPIHEAGHVFFMPFGQFMTILGGSFFQLLLPLIVAAVLLWQNRDGVGAALGVWWCGASLLDLAPYIYDAKHPQLILLGGHTGEDGPHDWIYLLGVFGKVAQSQHYGLVAHKLGVFLMACAILAGALLLWRMATMRKG